MPAQRRGDHQRSRQHPDRHPSAGARPRILPPRPGAQEANQEQQQQDRTAQLPPKRVRRVSWSRVASRVRPSGRRVVNGPCSSKPASVPSSVPASGAGSATAGRSRVIAREGRLGFRRPGQGRAQPVGGWRHGWPGSVALEGKRRGRAGRQRRSLWPSARQRRSDGHPRDTGGRGRAGRWRRRTR
jgi:hypothetical protein